MLPQHIRELQRENEAAVLAWFRKRRADGNPVTMVDMLSLSTAWQAALDRLFDAGKVSTFRPRGSVVFHYKLARYARPVTKA